MIHKLNIIIIGASSELAEEFIKLNNENNLFLISSKEIKFPHTQLVVKNYTDDKSKIIKFCNEIENPIVIFFNGYLKENRPFEFPNNNQIENTFKINYLIPHELTDSLLSSNSNIQKFVYISSFAAIKPRFKNFIYGASKKLLEESIISLELNNFLILRFGKIDTKMSSGHKKSFFDLSKKKAAEIINNKIKNSQGIQYGNLKFKMIAIVIKIIPKFIFKKFNL